VEKGPSYETNDNVKRGTLVGNVTKL